MLKTTPFDAADYLGSKPEIAAFLAETAEGGDQAQFAEAVEIAARAEKRLPTNPSGIAPLDLRVLVLPDSAETVTKGGIFLPETEVDKQKFAQCKATLIAVGVNAFSEAKRNPDFLPPAAGDRVLISKYGGIIVKGKDGVEYRLLNDEDVTARLEE